MFGHAMPGVVSPAGYQAINGKLIARRRRLEALKRAAERRTAKAKLRQREVIEKRRRAVLSRWLPDRLGGKPTLRSLLRQTARDHHVSAADLKGPTRRRVIVHARQDFCYRAYSQTAQTYPAIGRFINRDHTTVLHAVRAHAKRNGLPMPERA